MATIHPLEAPGHPDIGGLAITYPSGACKSLSWQSATPIQDPTAAAKDYAARLLDERIRAQATDDADRTNWPSVVACIQKVILDWNELTRYRLRQQH